MSDILNSLVKKEKKQNDRNQTANRPSKFASKSESIFKQHYTSPLKI